MNPGAACPQESVLTEPQTRQPYSPSVTPRIRAPHTLSLSHLSSRQKPRDTSARKNKALYIAEELETTYLLCGSFMHAAGNVVSLMEWKGERGPKISK